MLNEITADWNLWYQCKTWNKFETDANWHHLHSDVHKWNWTRLQRCQRKTSHAKNIKTGLDLVCQLQSYLYPSKLSRSFWNFIQWDTCVHFLKDWKSVELQFLNYPGYAFHYQLALALEGNYGSGVVLSCSLQEIFPWGMGNGLYQDKQGCLQISVQIMHCHRHLQLFGTPFNDKCLQKLIACGKSADWPLHLVWSFPSWKTWCYKSNLFLIYKDINYFK